MNTTTYNDPKQAKLPEIDYDPDCGVFTWAVHTKRAKKGDVAGTVNNDKYYRVMVNGEYYGGARLAWIKMFNEWPPSAVRCIDGDTLNLRANNLMCHGSKASDKLQGTTYQVEPQQDGRFRLIRNEGTARYFMRHYEAWGDAEKARKLLTEADKPIRLTITCDPLSGVWTVTLDDDEYTASTRDEALTIAQAALLQLQLTL